MTECCQSCGGVVGEHTSHKRCVFHQIETNLEQWVNNYILSYVVVVILLLVVVFV